MSKIRDDRPVNLNEGRHNPKFTHCDKKDKEADFISR